MPLADFLTGRKTTARRPDELMTSISLDSPAPHTGEAYLKIGRRSAMEVATTVEGLGGVGLAPIQQAFIDAAGVQCGFCTPGFLVTLHAFLAESPSADDDEIRTAVAGNICRCTGYSQIVEAAKQVLAQGGAA